MIFSCGLSCATRFYFAWEDRIIKAQNQLNGEIRDREIRVISSTGEQLGIMTPREALRLAEEENLDLVKISPTAVPPVCKIMDWGKFKFEQAKKEKENRKNQKIVELKEVQLSMTIDVGDVNVKAKQATRFLEAGNKVKVSIRLRGRQMAHASLAKKVMTDFADLLKELAVIEKPVNQEGRNLIMILAPAKK
ncbi:MAG: translation initiation factor IF-3 [Clostridia bacterium]|jgi:translation initiation factor IF-3|nr:translation initiation factor IF-3 [Clostridia bacterium]